MIDTNALIHELSLLVNNGTLKPETFDHLLTCHKEYVNHRQQSHMMTDEEIKEHIKSYG